MIQCSEGVEPLSSLGHSIEHHNTIDAQLPRRQQKRKKHSRRKRRRGKTIVLFLFFVLLLTAGLFLPYGTNVLFLGADTRPGDVGRADTLILASPRILHGGVKLLSIPRDTQIQMEGRGTQKINATYTYEGAENSREAVSNLIGKPVDGVVVFHFDSVVNIVDQLGGIEIDVDKRMHYRDPGQGLVIDLQPGLQTLNGEQALGYVRFRNDALGDITRVERQRQFVIALLTQALKPVNWPRLPAVAFTLWQQTETDLPPVRLLQFGAAAALSALVGTESETLPGQNGSQGGLSYWLPNPEAISDLVERLFP